MGGREGGTGGEEERRVKGKREEGREGTPLHICPWLSVLLFLFHLIHYSLLKQYN